MGNKTSQNQNISSLASEVDDIAMNYILTQNTIDLLRLTDKEYYDNLIILTSSVIEKKFNGLELGFLQQRIFGKQSGVIDIIPASNKMKDKVVYDISKFYIKIFMIYSAIATTIDPQYSYEKDGVKKTFYLKEMQEYKNIPKNVTPMLVNLTNPMNLCRKRLSILKNKLDPLYDENQVKLNPGEQLCSITATTSLMDEVGIKELDLLYFDIFDYETKTWSKRSAKMKQKYNKDLTLFYQIFTGKVDMPESITSFNDIELLDLSTIDNCARDSFKKDLIVSNKNELVLLYLEKIKLIEKSTAIYRSKLVNLLRELFVVEIKDNNKKRILNPKLTMEHILIIETDTRDNILNLYTSCEKYFIQALIIFEKIYDEQVKKLNEDRIDFIDQQIAEPDIEPDFHTESYLSNRPTTTTLTAYTPYSSVNSEQTATFAGLKDDNKNSMPISPILSFTPKIVQPSTIDSFYPKNPPQPPTFDPFYPKTPVQPPTFNSFVPKTPVQTNFNYFSPQTPLIQHPSTYTQKPLNTPTEPSQIPLNTNPTQINTQTQTPVPMNTNPTQTPEPTPVPMNTNPTQTPEPTPVPMNTNPTQTPEPTPVTMNTTPAQTPEPTPVTMNTNPTQTPEPTPVPMNTTPTQRPEPTPVPMNTNPTQRSVPTPVPMNTNPTQTSVPTPVTMNTNPTQTSVPTPVTMNTNPTQTSEQSNTNPTQTLEQSNTNPTQTQVQMDTTPTLEQTNTNPTQTQVQTNTTPTPLPSNTIPVPSNTTPTEPPSSNVKPSNDTNPGPKEEVKEPESPKPKSTTFMSFLLGKSEPEDIKKDEPVATNVTNKIKLKPL